MSSTLGTRTHNLQGRVVARAEELLTHDEVGLGVGVQVLDIVKDLGGTLTGTDDSNSVRSVLLGEDLGGVAGELGRVQNARVLCGKALGQRGLATSSNEDMSTAVRLHLASLAIAGLDGKGLNGTSLLALR